MARQETAGTIINRCAMEMGLNQSVDPYSTTDEAFVQLTALLNTAGQELVEYYEWQSLRKVKEFTTTALDTGIYDLPDDFSYMINQSQWDETNGVPAGGPVSAQYWAYLSGSKTSGNSIYASFRLTDNKLYLWPQPPPVGVDIRYEYIGRNWATNEEGTGLDWTTASEDIVLLPPLMMRKFLKAKFLEAKGFPADGARLEFENVFNAIAGKDQAAPILNAGGGGGGIRLLSPDNVSDSGYGS